MKGLENTTYLILYIISNTIALLMLLAAWKASKLARVMFFLLFAWASSANWRAALHTPQFYIDYADLTFSDAYKQFIRGWFSNHISEVVGFIATCQALIAVSMLLKGWIFKLGAICAIIFLLAIVPFGVGSAFPCTLVMAVALYIILRTATNNYLWIANKPKPIPI